MPAVSAVHTQSICARSKSKVKVRFFSFVTGSVACSMQTLLQQRLCNVDRRLTPLCSVTGCILAYTIAGAKNKMSPSRIKCRSDVDTSFQSKTDFSILQYFTLFHLISQYFTVIVCILFLTFFCRLTDTIIHTDITAFVRLGFWIIYLSLLDGFVFISDCQEFRNQLNKITATYRRSRRCSFYYRKKQKPKARQR